MPKETVTLFNKGNPQFLSSADESDTPLTPVPTAIESKLLMIHTNTQCYPRLPPCTAVQIINPRSQLRTNLCVIVDGDDLVFLDHRLEGSGEFVYGVKGFGGSGACESSVNWH